MERFRLREDLRRAVIDGFALPLGIAPGDIRAPTQGYTVEYVAGTDEEPDTYSFYAAVSHERVSPIVKAAFGLLPDDVCAILEISSRDAYRLTDVYLSEVEISRRRFLSAWRRFEPILMEDGALGAGANAEEPYLEIFLDQWKGISVIVPLSMRDDVEALLHSFGLEEVPRTWVVGDDNPGLGEAEIRPVLAGSEGDEALELDDLLLALRRNWRLELNVDPDTNIDEGGRRLGLTLWHALVGVENAGGGEAADVSVWATAGSLNQLQEMIHDILRDNGEWQFAELYATDRVAFDERPEELSDLAPRRARAEVHLVSIEPHSAASEGSGRG